MNRSLLVLVTFSLVLYQNCGSDHVAFNAPTGKSISSTYTGNGDGYLGKPVEGNYRRTFANYSCPSDSLGTQGHALVSSSLVTLQKDDCVDVTQNNTFGFSDPILEFAFYNPDYIALGTGIYEMENAQSTEPPITEAWCREKTVDSGIDVVINIDNNQLNSKAKIYMGSMDSNGNWTRSFVQPFSVSRVSGVSQVSYSGTSFDLKIDSPTQASFSTSATLTATVDNKTIYHAMACRVAYNAPVNIVSPYQLAQLPDNNAFTWIDMTANTVLLHLNNIVSSTFFPDSSGNGANANILGNITLNPLGKLGSSLNSDGVLNSYIAIPDSPATQFGAISFTLMTWYNLKSLAVSPNNPSKVTCPFGKSTLNSANFITGCIWAPARWGLSLRDSNGVDAYVETAPNIAGINQWSHVAFVVNRTNMTAKIYYNGVDATAGNPDISNINGIFDIVGSEMQFGGNFPINGDLDEIAIFKRALTPEEIQSIYNTQKIQF